MFHSNTELLIDYWRSRRGVGEAPARAAINPADFAPLLPQIIMLGRHGPGQYRVRLAGGFITDLYGRELRDTDFTRVWEPAARTPLQLALEALRRHPDPLVLTANARAGDGMVKMEVLLAPLKGPSGQLDRMIGLYQPLTPVSALKGGYVRGLALTGVTSTHARWPHLRLAAIDGREIA